MSSNPQTGSVSVTRLRSTCPPNRGLRPGFPPRNDRSYPSGHGSWTCAWSGMESDGEVQSCPAAPMRTAKPPVPAGWNQFAPRRRPLGVRAGGEVIIDNLILPGRS